MALVDVSASKTLSWNYDECILRTFRVEGACNTPPSDCVEPCGAENLRSFIVNVVACNVEDVCRKLREREFIKTIQSIQVFNAPFFRTDPPTENPFCLTDVTPILENCQECCEFLIDEDRFQRVRVRDYAMEAFSHQMTGTVSMSGSGNAQWHATAPATGTVLVGGQFATQSSHYEYDAEGTVSLTGEFGSACSYHFHEASGSVALSGEFGAACSHWGAEASGSLNISGENETAWGVDGTAHGTVTLSGPFTTQIGSRHFVHEMGGTVLVSGTFPAMSSHYEHAMSGTVSVSGDFDVTPNFYHHQMGGTVSLSGLFGRGYYHQMSGTVAVSGDTEANLRHQHQMTGTVSLSSDFDSISPGYYYAMDGTVLTSGQFTALCSHLGTVDFVSAVDDVGEETGVGFAPAPADALARVVTFVEQEDCCDVPIPASLTLTHNIVGIMGLERFLLRNGLSLPGSEDGPTLFLQYRSRFNTWQANAHLAGKSVLDGSDERWDLSFDLSCGTNSVWTFGWNMRRVSSTGDSIVRLVAPLPAASFCPTGQPFTQFEFTFNVQNRTMTPNGNAVFHDESSVFASSPSFKRNPNLRFKMTSATSDSSSLRDYSLEVPYRAALNVADASGILP